MQKIVSKLNKEPKVEDLITLYESDGVTPEYLKEMKVISEIPSSFYSKLSEPLWMINSLVLVILGIFTIRRAD